MKRGIYLVANRKSQELCENLIYSIRRSGCSLDIRLIHFGGDKIRSPYIMSQVEFLLYEDFPEVAKQLIRNIQSCLPDNPPGYLYRYLAWFSDWDEFIYSDNDIVALCNWNNLFDYLGEYDFLHADTEYITNGMYDYNKPEMIKTIFGKNSLESAFTSGHIVVKRNQQMIADLNRGVEWFKQNPDIPKKNDQSLMNIASLIGNWKKLNLCKPPYNWLSSWAGDYKNTLQIIQEVQERGTRISHLHYSGSNPKGNLAIEDLLFSTNDSNERLKKLSIITFRALSGVDKLKRYYMGMKRLAAKHTKL